jgi:hypothetical protein
MLADDVRTSVVRIEGCDDAILVDLILRSLERANTQDELVGLLAVLIDRKRAMELAEAVTAGAERAVSIMGMPSPRRSKGSPTGPPVRRAKKSEAAPAPAAKIQVAASSVTVGRRSSSETRYDSMMQNLFGDDDGDSPVRPPPRPQSPETKKRSVPQHVRGPSAESSRPKPRSEAEEGVSAAPPQPPAPPRPTTPPPQPPAAPPTQPAAPQPTPQLPQPAPSSLPPPREPPPPAASAAPATAPPQEAAPPPPNFAPFEGRWGIKSEEGKNAYLDTLDLNWMVRKAAKSLATPPIAFWLEPSDKALPTPLPTLHSQQGPIFGRMISSTHPPVETTTEETFQGVTSRITSQWEGLSGGDGAPPVLFCRTTTVGKKDVCDQRSRVSVDANGQRCRLDVETRLTKAPGAPTVVYLRSYEPLPPA